MASTTSTPHQTSWEPRTGHANGHTHTFDHEGSDSNVYMNDHLHDRRPSLGPPSDRAPLALRAHLLGIVLGFSITSVLYAVFVRDSPLWRLPFFLATLSLFHSLEYYLTASYNPRAATISAFLLDNGRAYNHAQLCAFVEALSHWRFRPTWTLIPVDEARRIWLVFGFIGLVTGQTIRSLAMAHAGSNFDHLVQSQRKAGHELVTHGVYAYLRHPSYFGFFWWALGTQVVLENWLSLIAFTIVLWRFFRHRIEREEEFLIEFFGEDYVRYKGRTSVGIPFIS